MEMLFASGNAHKKEELEQFACRRHTCFCPCKPAWSSISRKTERHSPRTPWESPGPLSFERRQASSHRRRFRTGRSGVERRTGGCGRRDTAASGTDGCLKPMRGTCTCWRTMRHLEGDSRKANFVCAIALVLSPQTTVHRPGRNPGTDHRPGDRNGRLRIRPGFFIDEANATMASLSKEEKNRFSHRGRAARRLLTLLDTSSMQTRKEQ
jgi:hypothetical protein